jgi:pimeloyl-ACP methyl ester carboxylesterase
VLNFIAGIFNREKIPKRKILVVTKEEKHPLIVFIHGAGQTKLCWNYYLTILNPKRFIMLEYNVDTPFYETLDTLYNTIKDEKDMFFISHSMGGLIALHLYDKLRPQVLGSISISSPFGGSKTADWARYIIPKYTLFKDVGVHSAPVLTSLNIEIKNLKWTQIISTEGGVPWHGGPNDGVVTVESQRAHTNMSKVEFAVNHYESISSPAILDLIKKEIKEIKISA